MAKQKPETTQKTELEARVDAMMDVNSDGIVDPAPAKPLDIFAGQTPPVDVAPSAPLVPHAATKPEPVLITEEPVQPAQTQPVTSPQADDVIVKDVELDTKQTDEAIDDIVAQEADEVLAAQDAGIERAMEAAEQSLPAPTQKGGHPVFWFTIAFLVILIAAAAYVLTSPGLTLPFGL